MLILISPAKNLNLEDTGAVPMTTQPPLLDEAELVAKRMRRFSKRGLSDLMGIGDKLAALNVERFKSWARPFTADNSKAALLLFDGDVYRAMDVGTLSSADLTWTQDHLRIISGLYGLLRPLDLIQPYRLEMGTGVGVSRKKNLYEFWRDKIAALTSEALSESGSDLVVNLASV